MASTSDIQIQLCGHLVIDWRGRRLEADLPGRQGRLLFSFLVLHRLRPVTRDELIEALWSAHAPPAPEGAVAALISKLRKVFGAQCVVGRQDVRMDLPENARVDLEVGREAIHRAESALVVDQWPRAWAASQTALFIARRGFLSGEDAPWVEECRREVDALHLRALETYGRACLGIGGAENAAAVRVGRELVRLTPYHESAHHLLIEALAATGNPAEALLAYESLRQRLREELGVSPGSGLQALHARLLRGT